MCIEALMINDSVKAHIIESITNKELVEELYYYEPFVCSILTDGFKEFLSEPSFDVYERKLALIKFLKNNYPLELSRNIVSFVSNCKLKDDYRRIILEWNYFAADYIKQYMAAQYDTQQLAFDLVTKQSFDQSQDIKKQQIDVVQKIADIILGTTKEQEK